MDSCEFCQYILEFAQDGFDDPAKAHEWFHGECSSSSCGSQRSPAGNLCAYCQHLRLPHLMLCLLNTGKIFQEYPTGVSIPFIPLERMLQEKCDLCLTVSKGIAEDVERVSTGFYGPFPSPRAHLLLPDHTKGRDGKMKPSVVDREAHIKIRASDGRHTMPAEIIFSELGENARSTSHSRRLYLRQPMLQPRTLCSTQLQPTVDWDRIRRAIVLCSLGHSRCKEQRTRCLPDGFRVIDVQKRCIREAGDGCQFVALSYVWGDNPDYTKLMATRSSVHMLKQEGSLVDSRTPRTISDAMEACIKLGERLLWADRLCIVQDDEDDKQCQIDSMAGIFGSAKFTIAVIDGTVDDGIPGMSSPRTPQHNGCTINNLEIMVPYQSPVIASLYSMWSQRGWTLQEALLSPKMLYFTKVLAYFRCQKKDHFEDVRIRAPWRSFRDKLIWSRSESVSRIWGIHVQEYRSRYLSDPKDIFNAFAGIAQGLFPCSKRPLHGLPRPAFDQALLWTLTKGSLFEPCPQPCYWDCPSWSWGYTRNFPEHWFSASPFKWVETLVRWEFMELGARSPTIQCARTFCKPDKLISEDLRSNSKSDGSESDPESSDSEISVESRKNEILIAKPEELFHTIIAIAWKSGCIRTSYPFDISTELSFHKMDKDLKMLLGDLESYPEAWYDQLSSPSILLEDEAERQRVQELLKPGMIVGIAQSSVFRVVRPAAWDGGWNSDPLHLLDRGDRIVGDLGKHFDPMADAEILPSMHNNESTVELIALSLSCISGHALTGHSYSGSSSVLDYLSGISYREQWENAEPWQTWRFDPDKYLKILSDRSRDLTFFDSEGNFMPLLPIVNVMAIGWSGPYAHRITTGWVLLTSWIKAEREFKTILLE